MQLERKHYLSYMVSIRKSQRALYVAMVYLYVEEEQRLEHLSHFILV